MEAHVREKEIELAILEHEPTAIHPADLDELEALWAAPAAVPRRWLPSLERWLAVAWTAFVVSLFFEPAPAPGVKTPAWAYVLSTAFLLTIAAAAALARRRRLVPALGAANAAAGIGVVLAITCRTTAHHLGWWPSYELLASGALLGLGVACLARATGRLN